MKALFPTLLLLTGLASCATHDPEPAPALTGGTWTLQSEIVQATEANGGPSTTIPITTNGQVTMRYQDERRYTLDVRPMTGAGTRHFEGTYSLQGKVLTYDAIYSWYTGVVVPRTVQVSELSAHQAVLVEESDFFDPWDKTLTHYVRTYTFSR